MWNVYEKPKISKQQTPANHGTEKWEETLWVVVEEWKKQEKITKKDVTKNSSTEPPPPQKKSALLNVRIQPLKNNYEEKVISLYIYWNNIGVICRNLFKKKERKSKMPDL